ncbi:MAG: hypothetical protein ACUVRL_11140, partial [Candidatus Saccharicenans sp.]|uniref:hypothetical protein n=1 Tax=Candidatus Saccharicenans sp. TaxID=2819258 RepID=UPI00404A4AE4
QPAGEIEPGQYSDFIVQFTANGGEGPKEAYLVIRNNDPDEDPYIIYLYGTAGSVGPLKLIEGTDDVSISNLQSEFALLENTYQTITWDPQDGTDAVRIEYSADNGSSYKMIINRTSRSASWVSFPYRYR